MKITSRDLDLMGWILEQKYMTEEQVRRVFWKDLIPEKDNREVYRRLKMLVREGYLKTNTKRIFRKELYLVAKKGLELLRAFNRDRGLGEIGDETYSAYAHDLTVTDIRILFHEMGYSYWLSERILSKECQLTHIPDGVILNLNSYIAIEYEASQKSRRRYEKIFLKNELDHRIERVLYIVGSDDLVMKLTNESHKFTKCSFVTIETFKKWGLEAKSFGLAPTALRQSLGETI